MSLKSEVLELLSAAEQKLRNESAHIAVSERNRMLDHLLAAVGAVSSADEPEQESTVEAAPEAQEAREAEADAPVEEPAAVVEAPASDEQPAS